MARNNKDKHADAPRSRQKSALGNIQNQEMNIPKEAQGPDTKHQERQQ